MLETVKGLQKLINPIRVFGIDVSFELFNIDVGIDFAVEKRTDSVHGVKMHAIVNGNDVDEAENGGGDRGSVGFKIINQMLLTKALNASATFRFDPFAGGAKFIFKDPC